MLIKTFQKRFRVVDLNQNKTQDLPEESADIKKKKKIGRYIEDYIIHSGINYPRSLPLMGCKENLH